MESSRRREKSKDKKGINILTMFAHLINCLLRRLQHILLHFQRTRKRETENKNRGTRKRMMQKVQTNLEPIQSHHIQV